ncbi:MAG: hypothetical protein DHS20C13_06520 [Thermodesulfobacteriota bacterium]|nr:MAG: hypothetical protein DHS20C13_06520 [Thermodesulfobacteriota bacterium]
MKDYKIRPYKEGDEININNAFNKVFGLNRSIEEWYWKFQTDNNGSRIMVAVDNNNQVFAHYAATLVDISVNGKIYKCGQPVDVYSVKQEGSVQHRLYLKTVREFFKTFGAKEKIQLLYGFPSARVLKLGQIKLDYGNPISVTVGKKNILKEKRLKWIKLPGVIRRLTKFYKQSPKSIDDLWERSSHRYDVSVVRNGDYIKRRYYDCPNNKYIYLSIYNNKLLSAWAVFKSERDKIKWIDLLWDGEDEKILIKLENRIEYIARYSGIENLEIWLSNDEKVKNILLNKNWEFSEHDDLFLVAMSFHPDLDSNKFIKNLYFTMGDSDLV